MRATFREAMFGRVLAENRWQELAGWWADHPLRQRGFIAELLFEPGQGWLRWSTDTRDEIASYYGPGEPYVVAPPLRRAWWWILGAWRLRGRARWSRVYGYRDPDRARRWRR